MTTKDEKAERLAAALRNNLRKRKQQARDTPGSDNLSAESRKTRD